MFDFPDDPNWQARIRDLAESDLVVAAVCQCPACLVNVKLSDVENVVKGKKMTNFTDEEEGAANQDALMPFLLEPRLRDAIEVFIAAKAWSNHAVVDGKLIAG